MGRLASFSGTGSFLMIVRSWNWAGIRACKFVSGAIFLTKVLPFGFGGGRGPVANVGGKCPGRVEPDIVDMSEDTSLEERLGGGDKCSPAGFTEYVKSLYGLGNPGN
jgi:hypothetical protein